LFLYKFYLCRGSAYYATDLTLFLRDNRAKVLSSDIQAAIHFIVHSDAPFSKPPQQAVIKFTNRTVCAKNRVKSINSILSSYILSENKAHN